MPLGTPARRLPYAAGMRRIPRLLLLLPLLQAACYSGPVTSKVGELDMLLAHDSYAAGIRAQQAKIAWENTGPKKLEFGDYGSVILREWQLYGLPGEEYMQVAFTYDNTTKKTFDRARVWVTVRDPQGEAVSRAWLDLLMPWFDFAPGNTYTTTIRVPTRGVHLREGWHWTIGCSTHEREEFASTVAKQPERVAPKKYSVRLPGYEIHPTCGSHMFGH